MFELPEFTVIAAQMNETIQGKSIVGGDLGNSPHKFVWHNRSPDEFNELVNGKTVGDTSVKGRWMFIDLVPGYVLLFGECGGRINYLKTGSKLPRKYHFSLRFDDQSLLTATTQMWGAYELYEAGEELEREYVKDMRVTPVETAFTFEYFSDLVDRTGAEKKRSVKALLTQEQLIPGLGNAIAQDIMFRAKLHPRHNIAELDSDQKHALYDAVKVTVTDIIEKGGRYDEFDLYGNRGGYVRLMDKNSAGKPCPVCGTTI